MHKSWMKRQSRLGYLFIGPNMIGVLLFFIIPAVYSFYLMFTDYKFMSPETNFVGLDNIRRMLNDDLFGVALRNTFVFLLAVPVSMGLAFIVAVALNKSVYWQKRCVPSILCPISPAVLPSLLSGCCCSSQHRGPLMASCGESVLRIHPAGYQQPSGPCMRLISSGFGSCWVTT